MGWDGPLDDDEPKIPGYASSACPGIGDSDASSPYKRYMSACSCIGVPVTYITPKQSVLTSTMTLKSTVPEETITTTVSTQSNDDVFTTIISTVIDATETTTVLTTTTTTQVMYVSSPLDLPFSSDHRLFSCFFFFCVGLRFSFFV